MSVDLFAVIAEHLENAHNYRGSGRQFIEGPNNENPWGREQGIANASYCDSGASMVPFHHGYRWWPESQCAEKGCAYTVFHVQVGETHGEVRFEHPDDPCDVEELDLLFYDWSGGKGSASIVDHVETAIARRIGAGRTHNVGYNTGSPGGCYDLWRDGKFLVCRLRPLRNGGYGRGTQASEEDDDMAATSTDELRYGPGEQCTIDLENLKDGAAGWRHGVVRIPWDFAGGPRTHRVRVVAWNQDGTVHRADPLGEFVELQAAHTLVLDVKPEWAALSITSQADKRDARGDTTVRTVFWR